MPGQLNTVRLVHGSKLHICSESNPKRQMKLFGQRLDPHSSILPYCTSLKSKSSITSVNYKHHLNKISSHLPVISSNAIGCDPSPFPRKQTNKQNPNQTKNIRQQLISTPISQMYYGQSSSTIWVKCSVNIKLFTFKHHPHKSTAICCPSSALLVSPYIHGFRKE